MAIAPAGPSILVTQCLQDDFVKPLGPHTPMPNLLHVGFHEAQRLMGETPADSPVSRVVRWAYRQSDAQLRVVHIRDWHDLGDPAQKAHLDHFGPHCLRDTPGAAFAFSADPPTDKDVQVVNSLTLNDFLDPHLQSLLQSTVQGGTRIGIMGVWTEAKITYLAYELATRFPQAKLALCSALTAGSSRAQHFAALDQLTRLLGVQVFPSVAQFLRFLAGREVDMPMPAFEVNLTFDERSAVSDIDRQLIAYLFRDCRTASLQSLAGGFSGNLVLGANSVSRDGHQQAPHVVKVGAIDSVARERMAFERIEAVLGNSAPRIIDFADSGERGALKYRYASMGGGFSTTFQKIYMGGGTLGRVHRILDVVFRQHLGRFYSAAYTERCDLLEHYAFSPKWSASVRAKVEALLETKAVGETLSVRDRPVYNLCRFYERDLATFPAPRSDLVRMSWVHGDLNGANIIIDAQDNVWLIDFFHTAPGHVLKDLIKLENDLLYIFTPLQDDQDLDEALRITDELLTVVDLAQSQRTAADLGLRKPALVRAWDTLSILRGYHGELVGSDRDPLQLFIGQMRYAVHTLGFDEADHRQKLWALYTAGRCAEKIAAALGRSTELRVDWMPADHLPGGRMGLTILPGRRDTRRDLAADIATLRAMGVSHVLCLVPGEELGAYGVPDLLGDLRTAGLTTRHLPIVDQSVPSTDEARTVVDWLTQTLGQNGSIAIHCVGGLGRSGTIAGCFLRSRGLTAADAIATVRAARAPRAIETATQEQFVAAFPGG